MSNLLDNILYVLSADEVKILLNRIDTHPELFSKHRDGMWDRKESAWLGLASFGAYTFCERWAIGRKCRRLDLRYTRERILSLLLGGDS
jgi:hypothetical protein